MGRLIDKFSSLSDDQHASAWSDLWESSEQDLWDRGRPSPSLVDLLHDHSDLFNPKALSGERKTFLVPGCGRGYDIVAAALRGFEAYGLEVSATAVKEANNFAMAAMKKPSNDYFAPTEDSARKDTRDAGPITVFQGDFFKRDWERNLRGKHADVIYDYTFLCALPPSMRKAWATRIAEILPSGGLLVCLEFPLYKDPAEQGPPWGLTGVYWDLLAAGGLGQPSAHEQAGDLPGKFNRVLRVKPDRQLPNGKGTDMISVWRRK